MDKSAPRVVEHTSPWFRLIATGLIAAAVVLTGFYLQEIGRADDFASVVVIVFFFTLRHWARRRPDRLRARFGVFGLIADAIRQSEEQIRQWAYDRAALSASMIALGYAIAFVVAKNVVVGFLAALYSWHLAAIAAALVGAAAAAPQLFAPLRRAVAGDGDGDTPATDQRPDGPEEGGRYDVRADVPAGDEDRGERP